MRVCSEGPAGGQYQQQRKEHVVAVADLAAGLAAAAMAAEEKVVGGCFAHRIVYVRRNAHHGAMAPCYPRALPPPWEIESINLPNERQQN